MAKDTLSKLQSFVSGFADRPFSVGLDVHKRSYHIALRRHDGRTLTWVSPAMPDKIAEQLAMLPITIDAVAYEAGPTGFGLARVLSRGGFSVTVAAPSRIPRPSTSGAKTDRLDCVRLADYASMGLLKPIAVPTEEEEAQRGLLRRRHQLVDGIRRAKQRIKALLLFLGLEEPAGLSGWTEQARSKLEKLEIPQAARWTLDSYMMELNCLEGNLEVVRGQLAELTRVEKHREAIDCLCSVPGVGPVVATTFRFEVFAPERFCRAEELASYLGLAPMVRQSGEGKARGRLRPVGQKRLKSLLVEAAWMWKAKDAWAHQQYGRILSRVGLAQKAIMALARKLAVILWRLCIERRNYRPGLATI